MKVTKPRIQAVLGQVLPDPDADSIVFYLRDKSNISEFIIAEELDLEIHRTRNLLYKLLNSNLVSFKRKKDKIKGWYICYWDFNEAAVPYLEEKLRNETIAKLEARLAQEQGSLFYMCRHAHVRLKFEDAADDNFKCSECGELMNEIDNSRTIEFLEGRLASLRTEAAPKKVISKKAKAAAKQPITKAKKVIVKGSKKHKVVVTAATKRRAEA